MSTIRKIIITIIIIGFVIGLFVLKPSRSEPPAPTVTTGNTEIATTQGSYCWDGLLSGKCVDKVYGSPMDMADEHKPTVVSPNEEINIIFQKESMPETLEVEKWTGEGNREDIVVKNNSIAAPKEKGLYVYLISADWDEGDGNYAFSVEVK
ncbi:hypothetical protein [Halobacillus trueperi]|nr:hypothetical protein [Halobacillus trueperi]